MKHFQTYIDSFLLNQERTFSGNNSSQVLKLTTYSWTHNTMPLVVHLICEITLSESKSGNLLISGIKQLIRRKSNKDCMTCTVVCA